MNFYAFDHSFRVLHKPGFIVSPAFAQFSFSPRIFVSLFSAQVRFSFGFPALAFPAAPFKTGKCGIWGFRPLLFDVKEAVCPHGQNDYLCDFQCALVYIFTAIV